MFACWSAVAATAAFLISSVLIFDSSAQPARTCNTALSRIAKAAVLKAIDQNRDTACSGIKQGPLGIDKTKELNLAGFELCEIGSVVEAAISVKIKCATSDAALIKVEIEDTASAMASADLDTCKVLSASASAENLVSKAGLDLAGVDEKLKDAIAKVIQPYCK
jgi:hypothetical protein